MSFDEEVSPEDRDFMTAVYLHFKDSTFEPVKILLDKMSLLEPTPKDLHIAETINWIGGIKEEQLNEEPDWWIRYL